MTTSQKMAKPTESQLTISCVRGDWSVETTSAPTAFLEASHAGRHLQHTIGAALTDVSERSHDACE